jgi:hypothetical protein
MLVGFSADYAEARTQFVEAATERGGELKSIPYRLLGPRDEQLSADIAWFGEKTAKKVFVALSGVHGVEGFFGSAVQVEWMRRGENRRLPAGTAVLLIHAINPYGFAWQRRTNEDNVDLNRNWIDFSRSLPTNSKYDEVVSDLCPTDWSEVTQLETGARLSAWRERNGGLGAYLQAVTGGQWVYPKALFFGGSGPSWSRDVMTDIVKSYLGSAEYVTILDFHTGLGPLGYAEPIIHRGRDDQGFARTRSWIGASATSLYGGGSISAEIHGDGIERYPILLKLRN